jgi:hypothetical protein
MVPRSSRVTDNAVKISMVMVRMVPTSPGTMLSRDPLPVSARARIEREARRIADLQIVREADCTICPARQRRAGRHRIGRVRRHSNAGLSPRRTLRSKPRGISTPNSTLPD